MPSRLESRGVAQRGHRRQWHRGGYRGFHPDAFVYGSVEQVAARFRDLAAMGYTDVIVRQLASEQSDAVASIERLAEVSELLS